MCSQSVFPFHVHGQKYWEGSECLLLVGMFVLLIGTDQTVNSRSPEVTCLIISQLLVHFISAHHRQILVLSGFPPEQLPYQSKGSLVEIS